MDSTGLYRRFIGTREDFDTRHRIVNGVALVGTLLTVFRVAADVAVGRPVNVPAGLGALCVAGGLYVHSRVLRRTSRVAVGAAAVLMLGVFAAMWFETGGVHGPSAILMLVLLPGTVLLFGGRMRLFAAGLATCTFAGLTAVEILYPELISFDAGPVDRHVESLLSFGVSALATATLFSVGVRSLKTERGRVRAFADRIEGMATTDSLTGLLNHAEIWKRLEDECSRRDATGNLFSVIMLDLDCFKSINDRFGHRCGDDVLVGVAGAIRTVMRKSDVAGRYGGEEFLLVLPNTPLAGALHVAARLSAAISSVAPGMPGIKVTCSIGVAGDEGRTAVDMVKRADALMYAAKRAGGGRVADSSGRIQVFDGTESKADGAVSELADGGNQG